MIRRYRVAKRLRGQVVLLESNPEGVTVDCLLRGSEGDAVLVTLSFSVTGAALPRVLDVLREWERRDAAIEVTIFDGPRGPQVAMSSANGRLVLTRRD